MVTSYCEFMVMSDMLQMQAPEKRYNEKCVSNDCSGIPVLYTFIATEVQISGGFRLVKLEGLNPSILWCPKD